MKKDVKKALKCLGKVYMIDGVKMRAVDVTYTSVLLISRYNNTRTRLHVNKLLKLKA